MKKYILALDQGTTSSRSVLFDDKARIIGISRKEIRQIFPKEGWVEHDPEEIYKSQVHTFQKLLKNSGIAASEIAALGITNQRETTVVWDAKTGKPVYRAIVWQDIRTADYCKELIEKGYEEMIRECTGLLIDSYFSATKLKWILDNVPEARRLADSGDLRFGTVDTWLIWKLTKGNVHATDFSNASRTMLFNIHKLTWDEELLDLFDIPRSILPEVRPSSGNFGVMEFNGAEIPISGVAGDQQAALFGQTCFEKGDTKITYGTGCFLLMHTGDQPQYSTHKLLTTIAWGIGERVEYALEGSVFVGGAAVQWLRDELEMIRNPEDTETYAESVKNTHSVFVVPAFSGLGAPYWDMDARGAVFGLTRDTTKAQLIKATLESIAYQSMDLIRAMQNDSNTGLRKLKVDGGASRNNYLMQFQADILEAQLERPEIVESTALGAAFLAGIGIGLWQQEDVLKFRTVERIFEPEMPAKLRKKLISKWHKAVSRAQNWETED